MSGHVSADLLHRFATGDVGEELAVQIAMHLDGCSVCNAHAHSLDPLHAYYASCDDPVMPADLVEGLLKDAHSNPSEPWLAGFAFLFLGGCVAMFAQGFDALGHAFALSRAGVLAGMEWMSGTSHIGPLTLSVCLLCSAIVFTHMRPKTVMNQ